MVCVYPAGEANMGMGLVFDALFFTCHVIA